MGSGGASRSASGSDSIFCQCILSQRHFHSFSWHTKFQHSRDASATEVKSDTGTKSRIRSMTLLDNPRILGTSSSGSCAEAPLSFVSVEMIGAMRRGAIGAHRSMSGCRNELCATEYDDVAVPGCVLYRCCDALMKSKSGLSDPTSDFRR